MKRRPKFGKAVLRVHRLETRAAPSATNALVSRADSNLTSDTAGGASYSAYDPTFGTAGNVNVSADGRFVAFVSNAANVASGQIDGNNDYDVFLFDRVNNS